MSVDALTLAGMQAARISELEAAILLNGGTIVDLRAENAKLREALEKLASDDSWLINGICDPNSSRFQGQLIAQAALLPIEEQ